MVCGVRSIGKGLVTLILFFSPEVLDDRSGVLAMPISVLFRLGVELRVLFGEVEGIGGMLSLWLPPFRLTMGVILICLTDSGILMVHHLLRYEMRCDLSISTY